MRIVIATKGLAAEDALGGHWSWIVQYVLGLRDLGHDVHLLDFSGPGPDSASDARRRRTFFRRLESLGASGHGVLLMGRGWSPEDESFEDSQVFGRPRRQAAELIRGADCMWNLCGSLSGPLRDAFAYRVLIDGDPGITQIAGRDYDLGFSAHHAFFTAGLKLGDADCPVPNDAPRWRPFLPIIHLPSWPEQAPARTDAPYTTVTGWWGETWIPWRGCLISTAKRDSFLDCASVPRATGRRITLATIFADEPGLLGEGWEIVDPLRATRTPTLYRRFLARSRGEFSCVKPIYRELRTGWFSERSAAYLALGRPVICENTGFSERLPTGEGLLAFTDPDGAVEALRTVEGDYLRHSRAARLLAEEHLDARQVLGQMLATL